MNMLTQRFLNAWFALIAFAMLTGGSLALADDPKSSAAQEEKLLAVLRSDAPPAEKAISCKTLAIYGSEACVADLAKLLSDPQLASWARTALEAIPGEAVNEALLAATDDLDGLLLVGTINSIGVRRDAKAVEKLSTLLQKDDSEIVAAAAVALGSIGNEESSESLRKALVAEKAVARTAIAEGCVLCAERLLAGGKADVAIAIYEDVRTSDVSSQRVLEATRGAILARQQEGLPLLIELFQSPEKSMFQLALGTAREFPGDKVDKALAVQLAKATPDRAALIIQAMADRPETVDLAAIKNAAVDGDKQVKMSALHALQRVGNESCLDALLTTANSSDPELSQVAKETLAVLPGEKVNSQIVSLLSKADPKSLPLLLELVGLRRIDAVDALLKVTQEKDASVRQAALIALGQTVTLEQLPELVNLVTSPSDPADAAIAQQSLKAASIRMADRDACASELAKAVGQAPSAVKNSLLEIIAEVGGETSLNFLANSAASSDPQMQDTASRLLGKWNGVDAAPVLLKLATTAPAEKYQIRALRGYVGLARKFAMPEPERVEMCRSAMDVSTKVAEQQLALDVMKLHPSPPALKLAIEKMQAPGLKEYASEAALVIAQKLSSKGVDVADQISKAGFSKVKLEILKATYGAGSIQKDVTETLQKLAGDLPLITLETDNYNASFGGDPAPGQVKQLKIEYSINGTKAEATYAENAAIVFPTTVVKGR
jgi:HEAT repeat protein